MSSISNTLLIFILLMSICLSFAYQLKRYQIVQFCVNSKIRMRSIRPHVYFDSIDHIFRLYFSTDWSCMKNAMIFSRCVQPAKNKVRNYRVIIGKTISPTRSSPRTMKIAAGDHRAVFSRSFALFTRTRTRARVFSVERYMEEEGEIEGNESENEGRERIASSL